jgi:hypothetical protein
MNFILIKNKKYDIKKFDTGGNNLGYIDFTKNKIGKILFLSEHRKINKTLDSENYSENPYREIEIHKQCNKLVKNKLTPNLVKYYDYHIYNNNIIIIIEKYDGNLNSIIDKLTFDEIWSIFFQIFITFIILQDNLGFYQGDFGLTNILYKKIKKTEKYFYYTYNGIKYKVPNEGYKIFISDYGNAIINTFIIEDYEEDYYSTRIKKRIELYQIILSLFKHIKNFNPKKINIINNIIFDNILFKSWNGLYSIDDEYTKQANHNMILKLLYNDYIYV